MIQFTRFYSSYDVSDKLGHKAIDDFSKFRETKGQDILSVRTSLK